MQHVTIRTVFAAPLALLIGAAPAWAQQAAPAPEGDPTGVEQANQTRELESEIEEYPAPTDGRYDPADPATRIPEAVEPAPPKPAAKPMTSKPMTSKPTPARAGNASSSEATSMIDPSEVQRVFGSDTRLIAIDSLDAATVTRMQARLQELGHYRGPVDGIAGPQTRAALGAYARAQLALKQRLLEQNQLTTDLAEQLGVEPSTRQTMPRSVPDTEDSPLAPPGAAPLPAPGMPLPTPSSAPPSRGLPPGPAGTVTPSVPPPSP